VCGEVEIETLFDDQLMVAFPKGDQEPPSHIGADAIEPDKLLLLEDGHCLRDHALAACNRPELRAHATMLGTSLHTLVQMVDNGLGVTMLPEMALDAGILDHTNIVARPLEGSNTARQIALIWRKNSPREKDFRLLAELLRKAAG
jgi:LysR family hydrogen peroxide-inducible transcriptional activator